MYCTIKDIKGAFNPKLDSSNQGVIIEARDSLLLTADRPWILEVQGTCDVNAAQFYFLTGHCQIGKHAEWKTNNAPGDSTQHAMTNMLWLVESHGRSHCSCISCHFSTNTVNQPNRGRKCVYPMLAMILRASTWFFSTAPATWTMSRWQVGPKYTAASISKNANGIQSGHIQSWLPPSQFSFFVGWIPSESTRLKASGDTKLHDNLTDPASPNALW